LISSPLSWLTAFGQTLNKTSIHIERLLLAQDVSLDTTWYKYCSDFRLAMAIHVVKAFLVSSVSSNCTRDIEGFA
jgi:hypothetical protein